MATFPANLQKKMIRSGYGIKPMDPVIRSDMEVGSPRTRRRTFARNDKVTFSLIVTEAELTQLRSFIDNDANGGAAWFDLALPGCEPADEAKLKAYPEIQRFSINCWKVDIEVEVR